MPSPTTFYADDPRTEPEPVAACDLCNTSPCQCDRLTDDYRDYLEDL
jgi:hypothetical protein